MLNSRPWPVVLDVVSERIGRSRDLVQGPGGNTSWKENDQMWVKASGKKLANALREEIFCKVNQSTPMVTSNKDGLRPSIESSLHASRPDSFVIHVHSVGAMSLGFRKELPTKALEILSEFSIGILDYFRPGIDLSKAIEEVSLFNVNLQGLLLKNHGLVLWGEDLNMLYEKLIRFEEGLGNLFPLRDEILDEIHAQSLEGYLENRYLTPDHAVFGPSLKELSFNDAGNWLGDLRYALEKALSCVETYEDLIFLSNNEVEALRNRDDEKLRQGLNT